MGQQQLPFAEAEGTYAERRALLWAALAYVGATRTVVRLCDWVFARTAGGQGHIEATRRELAAGPIGFGSPSTVSRATSAAARAGVLRIDPICELHGGQSANRLAIDWPTVRKILDSHADEQTPQQAPTQNDKGATQNDKGATQNDKGATQNDKGIPSVGNPAGETPRPRAGAPFVRSSSSLNVYNDDDERISPEALWQQVRELGNEVLNLLWANRQTRIPEPQRWTVARLCRLALEEYGRDWLLNGVREAAQRKPRDLAYAKGCLANQTGDRAAFFAAFDRLTPGRWYKQGPNSDGTK